MGSTVLSTRVTNDFFKRFSSFLEKENLNQTEGCRLLLELGLTKYQEEENAELFEYIEKRLDALEERIIKTASRGTKASLASLIGIATLLPANSNLTNALYNINVKAWSMMGIDIRDQAIARDQALMLDWQECPPSKFFDFCWAAGGKAQMRGQRADYQEFTKNLRPRHFINSAEHGLPSYILDAINETDYLSKLYGRNFSKEWAHQVKLKHVRESDTVKSKSPTEQQATTLDTQKYEEMKQKIIEGARFAVHKASSGLVFDIDHPDIWREPTEEELKERQSEQNDLIKNAGFSSCFWNWQESFINEKEAKNYIKNLLEEGYPTPTGYDGRWDREIFERWNSYE